MTTNLTEPRNRLQLVIESTIVNGIDFIELKAVDATTLYIHFLNAVNVNVAGIAASITGGDRITGIAVSPIQAASGWTVDANGNPILAVNVSTAGDFSTYTHHHRRSSRPHVPERALFLQGSLPLRL
jgi:membrane-associated protease RseP (regulator of RpoE activity)